MPRPTITTSYTPRTPPSSSYGVRTPPTTSYGTRDAISSSYGSRTDGVFLMTQLLDYLMTQDDNYIVLQNSYSDYTPYNTRPVISTSYN